MNDLLEIYDLLKEIQDAVSAWMYDNRISDIENLDIRISARDGWVNPPEIISESHKLI